MCLGDFIFPEMSVITIYYIYNLNHFYNQRIIFLIVELITFLGPGSIWFYYGLTSTQCFSPVDEDIHLLVIFYFVIALLLLIPTLVTCLNQYYCFIFVKIIITLYLAGKLVFLILMLIFVQNDYYESWENNICPNLQPLTTFWLIWNYIIISLSFIYSIIHIASSTCDYYDENDYDPV